MRRLEAWAEALFSFFEAPAAAAADARERAPLGLGLSAFALTGASMTLAQALAGGGTRYFFKALPWPMVLAGGALLPLATGFLSAAVFHLLAELMGSRRGTARGLFALLGLAGLPYALYLPLVLTGEVLWPGQLAVRAAALFVIALGVFVLKVVCVREHYELTTGRVLAILLFPYAAAAVLVLLTSVALGAALVSVFVS